MNTQLAPNSMSLPPPDLDLLDGARLVGWVRGWAIGFRGFANENEAAGAAWVAHRTLARRLAHRHGGRPAPIDVEPLSLRQESDRAVILASGRPIATLVPPSVDSLSGADSFGFEIQHQARASLRGCMNQHRLPDQIPPPCPAANAPTAAWAAWVREQWGAVQVTHLKATPLRADTPDHLRVHANVHLGSLAPADVLVEATADRSEKAEGFGECSIRLVSIQSYGNGTYVFEGLLPSQAVDKHCPLTVRVRPGAAHEALSALREVTRAFDGRSDVTPAVDEVRRTRLAPVTAG